MRCALIGAGLCNRMAEIAPLHTLWLNERARRNEQWALRLLDLCDSFDDARRMLITSVPMWSRTVLHLAVGSGMRLICAHAHSQSLCDEFFRGNVGRSRREPAVDCAFSCGKRTHAHGGRVCSLAG